MTATPTPTTDGTASPALSKWAATRQQVRRVWALSKPYFTSEEKIRARVLLASIVVLNLALVYMNVLFNDWNKLFYDALQEKNAAVFWEQLGRFTYLAFAFIVIAVYKFYLTQLMEMRWRAWMTRQTMDRWLSDNAFYRFELARYAKNPQAQGNPDNPDQRIQEDINHFTGLTVGLTMGLLNALVTLGSFVGILWTLSGSFSFSLSGTDYVIPGFMVWMAVLYCLAGSVITHYIGRPQIGLNFEQQRVEANFRHRMLRVREYSESIALDRGAPAEREQLGTRFGAVLDNYLALIRAQKRLVWFTSFFGQAAVVFPFVVAAPRFFSGAIQLGELMQISSAFGQVQGALSWIVDNYSSLASWRATTDRLTSFSLAFSAVTPARQADAAPEGVAAQASGLTVALPDDTVLLEQAAFQVVSGQSVLIKGPSGSGKSTLLRTLGGIWPFAQGNVACATDAMFLPQRPYIPDGSLRAALAYPGKADSFSDDQLREALQQAELPGLCNQLDQTDAWSQKLSGGEQQRLAIARVLLKKPRWIFADEATSALDEATEALLYGRLKAAVHERAGSLVSIAHRPGVSAFHSRTLQLVRQPESSRARYVLQESVLPG